MHFHTVGVPGFTGGSRAPPQCSGTSYVHAQSPSGYSHHCEYDVQRPLAAAYDAIGSGEAVGMRHVLAATVAEYQKLGLRVPASGFAAASATLPGQTTVTRLGDTHIEGEAGDGG